MILELTSEIKEGRSEGGLLWELMRILGFEMHVRFERVKGKKHFFEVLEGTKERYIHIGAHGEFSSVETSLLTPRGARIYPEEIEGPWAKRRRKPLLAVLFACHTGHIDFIRAFSEAGCRYVIAPLHETDWDDAALFSSIFYKLLLGERKNPWFSYKKALLGCKAAFSRLSGAWRFYENVELSVLEE